MLKIFIVHEIDRIFQNNILGGYRFILFNFAYISYNLQICE